HLSRLAECLAARDYPVGHPSWIRPRRLNPGRTRFRDARPRLCNVYGRQRARRFRDAEPGVSLRRRLCAAEHFGRPNDRLAGSEDTLSMTVTEPETAYPLETPAPAIGASRPRLARGAVRRFIRRSPLSAFWGCIAAAIIIMAVAAPVMAPYEP